MKVTVATPLYPPEVGGPAVYAKYCEKYLPKEGIKIKVVKYSGVRRLPKGVTHIVYFFKVLFSTLGSRAVFSLDMSTVAFPSLLAAKFLRKPFVIRVGGDVLYEMVTGRGKLITIPELYENTLKLTLKERTMWWLQKNLLYRFADKIIFTTTWQRDIMLQPYKIDKKKTVVIENTFPEVKAVSTHIEPKRFLWIGRDIPLKNTRVLDVVFKSIPKTEAVLIKCSGITPQEVHNEIERSYAVLLPSFSEISSNFILEAVAVGKPFISTIHHGLRDSLAQYGLFADPKDIETWHTSVRKLLKSDIYISLKSTCLNRSSRTVREAMLDYSDILKCYDAK